jgi:hypothetical protein
MGEVKIQTAEKNAEVFLDGAYAGIVQDLKTMWLEPGAYDLELKTEDQRVYKKRIYILSGKNIRITPVFRPETKEAEP